MSWFDSTLFVLVADHTALSEYPFYQSKVGMYSIPIIFYRHDSELKGRSQVTTQQIDIMPSILDYLHFEKSFFSFGVSVFDSTADHVAVSLLNDSYQIISDNYALSLDTLKNSFFYHYTTDSLLQHDLSKDNIPDRSWMEKKMKARENAGPSKSSN